MSEASRTKTAESQKVDLRGLICPEPVLKTKKIFDDVNVVAVEVLVDEQVNVNNLSRLARSLKLDFKSESKDDHFIINLNRVDEGTTPRNELASVPTVGKVQNSSQSAGTVVFLSKDKFGEGDPEFSTTLLNLFLQTMFESGQRPQAILMANSGVKLMAPESSVLKVLNDFKAAGTEVLACGLCVEFYKLKGQIPVEQITNMFAICEYMFAADKVLTP